MIQELKTPRPHERRRAFVAAAPDRPLTRRELLSAAGCLAAVSSGLAVCFWLQGLPLALPFSGLELPVLGAALCVAARRGAREAVTVAAAVRAAAGRNEGERRGPAAVLSGAMHRQA